MYQQITLIGNLGSEPEMRFTPTGTQVCSFSVAVTRSWTANDGTRQEKTLWFRVTAWRKLAENAAQYLTKGSQVLVVGELEAPNAWIDKKTGEARAGLEVTASTIRFLRTRAENGHAAPAEPGAPATAPAAALDEEDIPF